MVFYRTRMTVLPQIHMIGLFVALAMLFGRPRATLFFRIRAIDSRRTLATHFRQPNMAASLGACSINSSRRDGGGNPKSSRMEGRLTTQNVRSIEDFRWDRRT